MCSNLSDFISLLVIWMEASVHIYNDVLYLYATFYFLLAKF